ncbi:hypothetical protein L484_021332 [Morus notabilis]|uniref:Uncharacterized protein n=1 Tax=Morus notabilis TaxID=981085 RepID=W9S849_9ROSA|nr:hypothetical protein L484_021332 [Morus notabilis]
MAFRAAEGTLSEQLASVKEESMAILKDYITKYNVPNDVPNEPLEESSSGDEDEKSGEVYASLVEQRKQIQEFL